jgi:RHS repeat-associated protein
MTHIPLSEDNIGMYDIHPLAERHINREAWSCLSIYGTVENHDNGLELQRKYDSFGKITSENGPLDFPFGFAGGIYDKDTKLTRFGVRDYDSETGRWTSKEPLGFGGSRNFYVYVKNNPVMFRDPTGLILIIVGSQKFQNKVNDMLDRLSKISPYIKCVINNLKGSLITHIITSDNYNHTKVSRSDVLNNIPTNATIYLLPNFDIFHILHELWHAYSANNGIRSQEGFQMKDFSSGEEGHAIDFTNIIRDPFEYRTEHSGVDISEFFTKEYKNCKCIKE